MGRDKAAAIFQGKPLWRHVYDSVAPLFDTVMFSVRALREDLPYPQAQDAFVARGPIVGIASALMVVETEWVFIAGCDMPFIQPDLVRFMAEKRAGHDAVLGEAVGCWQPLLAFYAQSALPAMRARMAKDERSLMRLIADDLDAVILAESSMRCFDHGLQSFTDFDSTKRF